MKFEACPSGHKTIDILISTKQIWCFECRKFYDFKIIKDKVVFKKGVLK